MYQVRFFFGLIIFNEVFSDYFIDINSLIDTNSNIGNIISLTAIPLVIGFILSLINRGFYFGILLPKYWQDWPLRSNDYMNNRINELSKVFNKKLKPSNFGIECYDQKRRLHEYFNYILYGNVNSNENKNHILDALKLHRERINFQLSDLHAADTIKIALIILLLLIPLNVISDMLEFHIKLLLFLIFIFFNRIKIFNYIVGISIFLIIILFHIINIFCIQECFSLSIILFLILVTQIYRQVINDGLVRYETILIRSKEFRDFFEPEDKDQFNKINKFVKYG